MARVLTATLLFVCLIASAETFRTLPRYRGIGTTGFPIRSFVFVGDLRDGGVPEILACSDSLVFTESFGAGTYSRSWMAPVRCSSLTAGDRNGDGRSEVIVGTSYVSAAEPATISIFNPASYAPPQKITVPGTSSVTAIALGNVDGDAASEIVAVTSANTYVYDGLTLVLEWTATGETGSPLAIAEIDGDGKNEIILGGSAGAVLDASTRTRKWSYAAGFGQPFTTADVDGDGKAEIIGSFSGSPAQIAILNGDTFLRTTFNGDATDAIVAGDANNDGVPEIIGISAGVAHGYDVSTGAELWLQAVSATAAVIADPDRDGANELVAVASDRLSVICIRPSSEEWSEQALPTVYRIAAGDLDGNGRPEAVVAVDPGGILIFDGTNAPLQYSIVASLRIARMEIGQLDADPAREIVALGDTNDQPFHVSVYDGTTRQHEFTTAPPPAGGPSMTGVAIAAGNVDADAVDELITARSDFRFEVRNGASDVVQYLSEPLDGAVTDLALADTDGDSVKDLVVGTANGLYVVRTSDWSQRTHLVLPSAGATRVAATNGEILYATADGTLVALAGGTLAERWRCSSLPLSFNRLRYAAVNGVERGVAATTAGAVYLYPKNASGCPAPDVIPFAPAGPADAIVADFTGDGWSEVLAAFVAHCEVATIASDSLPRGDIDGDGIVTDADVDAFARFLYTGGAGVFPNADVNGDGCVAVDDLFDLIELRHGTGSAALEDVTLAAANAPADGLALGTGWITAGDRAFVPMYIRDVTGTLLGRDAGGGMWIQGFGFKVRPGRTNGVTNPSFGRGGVLFDVAPRYELSMPLPDGGLAYVASYAESTNPIYLVPNAPSPGNLIGYLYMTTNATLRIGESIPLTLDPVTAVLSNQKGSAVETPVNGLLTLGSGAVWIDGDKVCGHVFFSRRTVTFYSQANSATISVSTPCSWTAVSNNDFITVTTSGPWVTIAVTQNTTGLQRVGTVSVAGLPITVTQKGIAATRGDFNDDEQADVIWRNTSTGKVMVYVLSGGHAIDAFFLNGDPQAPAWAVVGAADVDGDGTTDLIWRNQTTGDDSLWLGPGPWYSSAMLGPSAPNWYIEATGDFTGDGTPDIVWHDHTSGIAVVWRMVKGKAASGTQIMGAIPPWHIVAANDFDNDGQTDLMWRNLGDGQNVFWKMNGMNVTSARVFDRVANTDWRVVASADYDRDGLPDLYWRNVVTGMNEIWSIQNFTFRGAIATDALEPVWEGGGPR